MLNTARLMAFAATADADRARVFYEQILGLKFISQDHFAVAFDANGTPLRIAVVEKVAPVPYTVLGWQVMDITITVQVLITAGVQFERFPFMTQDAFEIWDAPGGDRVAWFKDPDGNLLSVSQHAR